MSENKIDQIVELVSSLSVLEVSELVKSLEEKLGVSAAAVAVAAPAAGGSDAPAAAEKTNFDVKLVAAGSSKIQVIKVVKTAAGLGLVEAKAMVEKLPAVVKADLNKEDAEALKAELEKAGATVELS